MLTKLRIGRTCTRAVAAGGAPNAGRPRCQGPPLGSSPLPPVLHRCVACFIDRLLFDVRDQPNLHVSLGGRRLAGSKQGERHHVSRAGRRTVSQVGSDGTVSTLSLSLSLSHTVSLTVLAHLAHRSRRASSTTCPARRSSLTRSSSSSSVYVPARAHPTPIAARLVVSDY